jgi:hypothetical protein
MGWFKPSVPEYHNPSEKEYQKQSHKGRFDILSFSRK